MVVALSALIVVLLLAIMAVFALSRHAAPTSGEVLLVNRLGARERTIVRGRGTWVQRRIDYAERVELIQETLTFERSDEQAVTCKALSRANLRAVVEVALGETDEDVLRLAELVGSEAVTAEGVHALLEPIVHAALGGAAARHRADDLDEHFEEIASTALSLIGRDLWGLVVRSVRVERAIPESAVARQGPFR